VTSGPGNGVRILNAPIPPAFTHLHNYFGDEYLINNIDRNDILGFDDYLMKKKGLTNSSINSYFRILSSLKFRNAGIIQRR